MKSKTATILTGTLVVLAFFQVLTAILQVVIMLFKLD